MLRRSRFRAISATSPNWSPKTLRPIPGSAETIQRQVREARLPSLVFAVPQPDLLVGKSLVRDPPLRPPEQVLAVAFDQELDVPAPPRVEQRVREPGLGRRMQSGFRLFEEDRGTLGSLERQHQHRKRLRDPEADIGDPAVRRLRRLLRQEQRRRLVSPEPCGPKNAVIGRNSMSPVSLHDLKPRRRIPVNIAAPRRNLGVGGPLGGCSPSGWEYRVPTADGFRPAR